MDAGIDHPPPSEDSARTRDLPLDAATHLFAARGFDGVTTDEIARAAGVNKAMINYHFGGKEGLYRAILLETFAGAHQALAAEQGLRGQLIAEQCAVATQGILVDAR